MFRDVLGEETAPSNSLPTTSVNTVANKLSDTRGAWVATPINDSLGRRGAIFAGAVLSLLSVVASGLSQNWPQLLVARLVLGMGMGLNATTVSMYAAECAPAAIRGGLAVSWQMNTAFGIFLGFCAVSVLANEAITFS